MLISISKHSPLVKNRCVEIAFAEIICKTLLKSNSRPQSVLSKMVSFVKIASHRKSYANFNFQVYSSLKKHVSGNSICRDNL